MFGNARGARICSSRKVLAPPMSLSTMRLMLFKHRLRRLLRIMNKDESGSMGTGQKHKLRLMGRGMILIINFLHSNK